MNNGMGRPLELSSPWLEMAEKAGGTERLCDALGIGKSTLGRWVREGKRPRLPTQAHVNGWAKRRGLTPPFPES